MSTHIRSPEGNGPSVTARRVAAHRLGFSRVPAPYGTPAADEAVAADVAAGLVAPANRMHGYLAALATGSRCRASSWRSASGAS